MQKKLNVLFFIFFGIALKAYSQSGFNFIGATKKQIIPFELVNNIIIIPLEVNGKELSFILDTGVKNAILFNLNPSDSLSLNNVKKVQLYGMGSKEPIEALLSKKNRFRLRKMYSNNQDLYVIFNDSFDLSSKLGKTIHGIIGSSFFKNFIVEVNYAKKRITVNDPKQYKYKKCRKCEVLPLEFLKNRPYINVSYLDNKKEIPVKLLLDTGSSDSMWLFEDAKIQVPEKYFLDYLGVGLSGNIEGKRSRVSFLKLGKFLLKDPTAAFPDSISVPYLKTSKERNGSVGGAVLSRFKTIYDYKNKILTLKSNRKFKNPFKYNMSGLEVIYSGKVLVKELVSKSHLSEEGNRSNSNNGVTIAFTSYYTFKFKPSYRIFSVRTNSPAMEIGLQPNDIIIEINNKPAYEYKLEQIYGLFYEKENKRIELLIERKGVEMGFVFKLKKLL